LSEELGDRDESIKKAIADGFEVIYSDAFHLLLDLDTAESVMAYERGLVALNKTFPEFQAEEESRWNSKSGNLHVVVVIKEPIEPWVILLLQAALGSDGVREMISLKQLWEGTPVEKVSVLFKPKHKKGVA
jgi:hypothetical protein